ncbi:MAG: PSD1 and planctomycete cytochrome C domain-containing protein [Planctomycetota bacterium]
MSLRSHTFIDERAKGLDDLIFGNPRFSSPLFWTSRFRALSLGACWTGLLLALLAFALAENAKAWISDDPTPQQLEFFEREVRPLLAEHCYSCHSNKADRLEASLYVDSRNGLLEGGDSGEAIVPGDPDNSLFMEAVRYDLLEMPPAGKLPDEEIAVFEKWIRMGAPWPKGEVTNTSKRAVFDLEQRREDHWVWSPVQNPKPPQAKHTAWPEADSNQVAELDHFILAGLEQAGLQPAARADKLALLRRVYMDLIGLPPTVEEIRAFEQDTSEAALDRVVDKLLDSPHFGERWGRHWLDLVRYAESRGHEFDNDTPNAFQYRDYIIRALNEDVPYDQLVREHIAGDLLRQPRLHPEEGFNESVLGTGFWYLGEWVHSPVDIRKDESDRFDNMIDVMSKTFLGVTVSCARCHDHKFDAISTADYYSLTGYLHSSDYRQVRFESVQQNARVADQLNVLDQQYRTQLQEYLKQQGLVSPSAPRSLQNEPSVLFDFGEFDSQQLMQDGFIFGLSPRNAGLPYLKADGSIQIAIQSAAANDAFWNGLKSETRGGVQNRSKVAKLPKSGRTLRSPTFELSDGKISCRVEGEGHVVACVDSHRLVAGPLHGATIQSIRKGSQWTHLNLSRYIGHRLHLEFVPAENAELAVSLVAQGLDAEAQKRIDRQIEEANVPMQDFAQAAEALLNDTTKLDEIVYSDFESGTYGDWIVEGEAFGERPQTRKTIADYQGDVQNRGRWFVNSHNIRGGGNTAAGDRLTGTLTSPEFTIDCDRIVFLVGGGSHAGKTCINLLVDGKVVQTTTGDNNNRMTEKQWEVAELAGKQATIQIVDNHRSGWGNIGVDHIRFLKRQSLQTGDSQARQIVAKWRSEREKLKADIVLRSQLAPAMLDGTGEDANVYIRGNASNFGEVEPRHFLTAVSGKQPMQIQRGSGRLELAQAINDLDNPLTSRVIVNRIWHYLMGRGIVPTTDDFGVLGQKPTHPELLDHLASKFTADGQSIKKMVRYIILSQTYQMSSQADETALAADPKNMLWHHRPPKRLEGEAIRDFLLSLSGRLDAEQFGPAVPIHLTAFMDGRGRPGKSGPLDGDGRRSIYISVRRNFISPFMLAFDTPTPFSTMGRRNVSNVPAQALILMNDPFVADQAQGWAKRALAFSDDQQERILWLYRSAFARAPTAAESAIAKSFLGESNELQQWTAFAHALINTKEFIFLK